VNSAEENRAKFCKFLNGKPLFSALYGMLTVTLNELKAVMKMNAQAGRSRAVNETSLESTAQGDDFQEVKRPKRHINKDTSETARSRLNQSQHPQLSSSLQKQCQLANSSHS
jgi:hypothetical protein